MLIKLDNGVESDINTDTDAIEIWEDVISLSSGDWTGAIEYCYARKYSTRDARNRDLKIMIKDTGEKMISSW